MSSSNTNEGTVLTSSLLFITADWNEPQTVTITGFNDDLLDGNIAYTIVLGAAASTDPLYNGVNPADVFVTNIDDDTPQTKFYVVNDGSPDRTYEYSATATAVENYAINTGNTAPRGAASTAAGNKVWVVDANKKVYVYTDSGATLGSWTAGSLAGNATVEGVATNDTDVWIVDARQDRVYRYDNAANLLSGSQSATSSFALNNGNLNPKDIVTDGTHLWVVNDSTIDKVFKYTLAGDYVGNWTITTPGVTSPTGITLDPTNVSHLWIVDNGTDRVYQYNAAAGVTSDSMSANSNWALAAGNTNPQGIADPPPGAQLQSAADSLLPVSLPVALDFDKSIPPVTAFSSGAIFRQSDSHRDERSPRNDKPFVLSKPTGIQLRDSNLSAIPPVRSERVAHASEVDKREAFDEALLDVLAEAELARYASVFED